MTDRTKGILSLILVCVAWGLSAIYYRALHHVPPFEVLAHRTIWSLVFFCGVLAVQGRLASLARTLRSPLMGRVLLAAIAVSANWGFFIWAVQHGEVVESSFGYYIFPLFAVLLGVALFGERLSPTKWLAVALAAGAVLLLALGLGTAPWLSLALASTFALYGAVKKGLPIDPVLSVAAEVAVLAPVALAWLVMTRHDAGAGAFGHDLTTSLLLIGAGPMTAIPLILFARAARSVDFATVGVLSYLNPTIQFFVAVLLFGERFTRWHAVAFALIWAALAIYSAASFRAARRQPA